ncbi:hypothetical protein IscW_ISCW011257 [Ixodes scapularis]|uniref:F-box domain-containing protein n=1 Tax=Ixodes scapularis TaxID=6945 RepID=B7Q849_IXOSC|nr:hypothetical protein IscW_ISCW011257 [Ixodes scapularis]|eukprot:XP_002412285.1 hypothetical protein IscW_ISCW011257 [Ixodes scapularis]
MDDVSTRMGPGPDFCHLPCELQLLVLSYLSHGELVLVARVSKALRRLAYDPYLWRTVTVCEDMDDRWLQGALDHLSQLEALDLHWSPLVLTWAAHAARFPKLRLLDELGTLRRLNLDGVRLLTARGLGSLFQGGSMGRLISLELDLLKLDDQALGLVVKGTMTEAGLATVINNCP